MKIYPKIETSLKDFFREEYDQEIDSSKIQWSETRREFDGDYTLIVFPFIPIARCSPEDLGKRIGDYFVDNIEYVSEFNVIKGFLNVSLSQEYWFEKFNYLKSLQDRVPKVEESEKILVEYCSPNTNKPLHLGHIRNILLGDSVARILETAGHDVVRTQVINDKGIAICKSMLAWQKWGNGETPESKGIKGDHFVGSYYVLFDANFKEEYLDWQSSASAESEFAKKKSSDEKYKDLEKEQFFKEFKNEYFNKYSKLGREAKELLLKWENKDSATMDLWNKMNTWVYDGFRETFENLNISFDKNYYESETYLLGKDVVEEGLEKDVFETRDDGSVWADLSEAKLDEKIVQRADGTSLYITQDLGTAEQRYKDFSMDRMIYVVGDEQEYHFQVLFEMLKRLGAPYAEELFHLSYGMVDLPDGKMKSREGNVVDADDIMREVVDEARSNSEERGELADLDEEGKQEIFRKIGLSALKFFILKINPRKRMVFNPEESVDVHGQTGPYVQNAYVRIQSILRKAEVQDDLGKLTRDLNTREIELIKYRAAFKDSVAYAVEHYDPSVIADYAYRMAKKFHQYYHEVPILRTENEDLKKFRLLLIKEIADTLEEAMNLLGIEMPQRM